MAKWKFFVYVEPDSSSLVEQWKAGLGPEARATLDNIILRMASWGYPGPPPGLKALTGVDKILEIQFEVKNIAYRPLCCFGPRRQELTILVGATKKQGKTRKDTTWDPGNAIERATQRRLALSESSVREYRFDPPTAN